MNEINENIKNELVMAQRENNDLRQELDNMNE